MQRKFAIYFFSEILFGKIWLGSGSVKIILGWIRIPVSKPWINRRPGYGRRKGSDEFLWWVNCWDCQVQCVVPVCPIFIKPNVIFYSIGSYVYVVFISHYKLCCIVKWMWGLHAFAPSQETICHFRCCWTFVERRLCVNVSEHRCCHARRWVCQPPWLISTTPRKSDRKSFSPLANGFSWTSKKRTGESDFWKYQKYTRWAFFGYQTKTMA